MATLTLSIKAFKIKNKTKQTKQTSEPKTKKVNYDTDNIIKTIHERGITDEFVHLIKMIQLKYSSVNYQVSHKIVP